MRLFHALLASSMPFPPCPLYKLLGLDEEVGELSLGLICRTSAQSLNKEGFEEQKREENVGKKERIQPVQSSYGETSWRTDKEAPKHH